MNNTIKQVVQDEMYEWLQEDDCAKVALFDATNTTKSRRQMLVSRSKAEKNTMLVFIESICDDPEILAQVGSATSYVRVILQRERECVLCSALCMCDGLQREVGVFSWRGNAHAVRRLSTFGLSC